VGHIIITHLSGSKVNQVEQLSLDGPQEFSFGRDPNAAITFDPDKDELVSRRHAVIRIEKTDPLSLTVSDVGSSNGTLVNGARITAATEIFPGDVIEFGAGGPKVKFDVEPRPPHFVARARSFAQHAAPETRVAEPKAQRDTRSSVPAKAGVGAETVERMLSAEREATGRLWMYGFAALLTIVALVGAGLFYRGMRTEERLGSKVAATEARLGQTPKDIAAKFANAVVQIDFTWKLYHKQTGRQVFQKVIDGAPAYVDVPIPGRVDSKIYRWLVTEDENGTNKPIGGSGYGSGIVINDRGFILTNKHIAAPWLTYYQHQPYEYCNNCGARYKEGTIRHKNNFNPSSERDLFWWVPGHETCLFDGRYPKRISCSENEFEGRADKLEVGFPGQRAKVQARFTRSLDEVDLALVKIDVPFDLQTSAILADRRDQPTIGEKITVMGYPEASEKTYAQLSYIEAGEPREQKVLIPEPTVIEGVIANIGKGMQFALGESLTRTYGSVGDVYQLTVNTVSDGTSGGPVINNQGKVVGIFTYAKSNPQGDRVTFAVPIRYGHDLLELQSRWN
jgi:S1-C subfamily serine protease